MLLAFSLQLSYNLCTGSRQSRVQKKAGCKMNSDKTINTLLNAELPPSADNALNNLTNKPTLSIGTTFADLWDLVFGGISYLSEKKKIEYAHKLELYRKELEDSIKQIPPEKVTEPSIQVTAQALENSKYCVEEEELRHMFTSLISNSMNTDFSSNVHPSFAEILKQMSSLDAKILRLFKTKDNISIGLPVCQYCLNLDDPSSFTPLPDHIFFELPDVDFHLCSMSLSSLSRLGIVSISYLSRLTAPNTYEKFSTHPFYLDLKEHLPEPLTLSIRKGSVTLTPLGLSFVKVCVPD